VSYKSIFKFSLPLLYASIFGTIIASADQFFVSRYFGAAEFAEFSNGFMELPFVGMIVGACTTVLFPLFSKIEHESQDARAEIMPIWRRVFDKTSKLVYPLLVFCWFMASDIMVVLYGEQYAVSDTYFQIRLITNIFTLIAYAPLILAIGKTKTYANVHLVGAVILVLLEYMCVLFINTPYAVAITSVICHIGRIVAMLYVVAKYFGVTLGELFPIQNIVRILLPCAVIGFGLQFIMVDMLPIIRLLVCSVIYAIVYCVWAYIAKIDYMDILTPFIGAIRNRFSKSKSLVANDNC
jgi:O-antigen/teichoic acid export membrane protein